VKVDARIVFMTQESQLIVSSWWAKDMIIKENDVSGLVSTEVDVILAATARID